MATGVPPFEGSSPAVIFAAILGTHPDAPSHRNYSVPAKLDRVIMKTLEKDRAARYQTAAELRDELLWITKTITTSVPATRARRSPRRTALKVSLVAVLTLGIVAGLFW